jgi:flagellar motor switch protein FliN/FliY
MQTQHNLVGAPATPISADTAAPTPSPESTQAEPLSYEPLGESAPESGPSVLKSTNPLLAVKTRLEVCVGETSVTVGELVGAKEGHVLRLDREVDQPVDIRLDGKVVARGILVAVGDHFAVRLTELPAPLSL